MGTYYFPMSATFIIALIRLRAFWGNNMFAFVPLVKLVCRHHTVIFQPLWSSAKNISETEPLLMYNLYSMMIFIYIELFYYK